MVLEALSHEVKSGGYPQELFNTDDLVLIAESMEDDLDIMETKGTSDKSEEDKNNSDCDTGSLRSR